VHEKTYFHICNSGLTVEIASTSVRTPSYTSDTAQLSFTLSAFDTPITVHIPILSADFLQTLSDMALRANAALAHLNLNPVGFVKKPRCEIAQSRPVSQHEAMAAFTPEPNTGDTTPATPDLDYPKRGCSSGTREVGGVTYNYVVPYIRMAAGTPWVADSTRTQEFTPAADDKTAAEIVAHVLSWENDHPEVRVGYVNVKA
jgi:hypothetical protein